MSSVIDLLKAMCAHTFDSAQPNYETFIRDGKTFNENQLLQHPMLRANLLFLRMYECCYGSQAPSMVFQRFYDMHMANALSNSQVDMGGIINAVLTILPMVRMGVQLDINTQTLSEYWARLQDKTIVRGALIKKWERRFSDILSPDVDQTKASLPKVFLTLWKRACADLGGNTLEFTHYNDTVFVRNPFTEHNVEVTPNAHYFKNQAAGAYKDIYNFLLVHDMHFIARLVGSNCVVLCIEQSPSIPADVMKTIECISNASSSDRKPCIFLKPCHLQDPLISKICTSSYHVFMLQEHILDSVPRVARWCCVISDNLQKTNIKPLASKKENNVLLALSHPSTNNKGCEYYTELYDRLIFMNEAPHHPVATSNSFMISNTTEDWKYHMQCISPFVRQPGTPPIQPQHHQLIFIDFLARYYALYRTKLDTVLTPIEHANITNDVIVLVDNRINPYSVLSMKISAMHAPWSCVVVTSANALRYYERELPAATIIHDRSLDQAKPDIKFDIDMYNELLEQPSFWSRLEEMGHNGHALIIQDDGILVRTGVERFLDYDYVGAPWADDERNTYIKQHIDSNLVGNGGFSLRKISTMKNICVKYASQRKSLFFQNMVRTPEDVFFVKYLKQERYRIAPASTAVGFASEQMVFMESIGFHKFWVYNDTYTVVEFFQRLLKT